jgi:peroxiredoxin
MSLAGGAQFPVDIAVDSRHGRMTLSDVLNGCPAVVAFHRLWCPFCQQAARDLAGAHDQFERAGVRVVIVYREDIHTIARSCTQRSLPAQCVSDLSRELEAAADITPFPLVRYVAFSPRRLVAALRSGSHMGRATTGFLQGRGTFVIDRDARVVYAHRSVNAADIAPIDEVLTAARSAAGRRPSGAP